MAELDWLGVVRHGESTGNVAATAAETAGTDLIDIPERDADVPLSETGEDQAAAVGRWLTELPEERPGVAVVSPYLRTRQTAELALRGLDVHTVRDERLRDRELGIIDLMTGHGVRMLLPAEAERRQRLGKFYYRPPGGESWADVVLRLRSLLRDVREEHPGGRVLLVGHEVTVLLLRYLVDGLDEPELMDFARGTRVANGSISTWRRTDGHLKADLFNAVDHLYREGAPPTREKDIDAEPI